MCEWFVSAGLWVGLCVGVCELRKSNGLWQAREVEIAGRVLLICLSCVKDHGSGQGRRAVNGG